MNKFSIIIGADLVPTKSNLHLFENGNINDLIDHELCMILHAADYRIFNLEVPLSDKKSPISKCGPALIAPTKSIEGIKTLNPNLLTLANNHIMDQGENGLHSTLNLLKTNDVAYIGAGTNIDEASKAFLITKDKLKIAFYACAEHEFSIATKDKPGANPFDPFESLDHIAALKRENNYVIVLYHGGKEHYQYPSPYLQKVFHKLADKGADIIIAQHSHCIGCEEKYNNSILIYGQGNFLFDGSKNELWKSSILINLQISNTELQVNYIPIIKSVNKIIMADTENKQVILNGFRQRSLQIQQPRFVEDQYTKFARHTRGFYTCQFLGNPFILRLAKKMFNLDCTNLFYSKKTLLALKNFVDCEAHRELLSKSIDELL